MLAQFAELMRRQGQAAAGHLGSGASRLSVSGGRMFLAVPLGQRPVTVPSFRKTFALGLNAEGWYEFNSLAYSAIDALLLNLHVWQSPSRTTASYFQLSPVITHTNTSVLCFSPKASKCGETISDHPVLLTFHSRQHPPRHPSSHEIRMKDI